MEFCNRSAELAANLAPLFLLLSFLVAVIETGLALWAKYLKLKQPVPSLTELTGDLDKLAKLIEALKGLLVALKDLPAWIALFLAGLALVWTSGQLANLCTA